MAASNPAGGNKFWFNGAAFEGVSRSGVDTTGLKFWFNGIPLEPQFPAAASTTTYAAFSTPQHSLSQVIPKMIGY